MPDGDVTLTGTWIKLPVISVEPADIIIYMGGDAGHDGVVNDKGEIQSNVSLPIPGFTVTLPDELADTDVTALTFREYGGGRTWTLERYDGRDATEVYRLVPADGQKAVRVQFKLGETVVTSDEFDVGEHVNQTLEMSLYKNNVGLITVDIGEDTWIVDSSESATLTVRGTTDKEQYAPAGESFDQTVNTGKPGLTAPAGTVYAINGGSVQANADSVALLFDGIIDTSAQNRTELLWNAAAAGNMLPTPVEGWRYACEFRYLDLVDTHNGNVWVEASNTVTVYWPLPAGTTAGTEFTLLHFKDLDRDMESGDIAGDIAACEIEGVRIKEVTGTHIVFEVTSGNFSPFALIWQEPVPTYGLSVTKEADREKIEVGEEVAYTITVTNTGNQPLENITVGSDFDGKGELKITGDLVFDLEPDESVTITATYKALSADAGRTLTNTVTVKCDRAEASAVETVKVERPLDALARSG